MCGTVGGLLVVAQALLVADIVSGVVWPGAARWPLDRALAWLFAAILARAACTWGADALALDATARIKARLRQTCVERLLATGLSRLPAASTGALTVTLASGVDHLDAYEATYRLQRVLAVVVPLAAWAAATWIDPLSGLVLAVTGPLIPLFMVLLGSVAREQTERQWLALTRLGSRFLDAIQAIPTLAALGQLGPESARLAAVATEQRTLTLRVLRTAFLSALVLEWLATLGTAIVAVEVGLRLLYDRVAWDAALAVLLLAPEFYRPLRALGSSFHAGLAGREVSRRLDDLDRELGGPSPVLAATAVPAAVALDLDRVTVRRRPTMAPTLDGVTLQVRRGEWLAIVGPSGAGKSTVLEVLLGLVPPDHGAVRVAGIAVPEQAAAARQQLSWVAQRPHLFHGTVGSNLLMAAPGATPDAIGAALQTSAFDRVLRRLPDGLDTVVGEDGAGLSGGEIQRLALARALLKGAPILLLDEPTSELDPANERHLLDSLAGLSGITRVMVTHRVAAARRADRVVVLEGGRIREDGTPEVLARGDGAYARLTAAGGAA